jgi:hypothetical protein
MSRRSRNRSYAILTAVGLGLLALSVPAQAGVKGRRTTTAVLAGVAAYHLTQGHTKTGLLAAGGAAYAYKRTQDAKKAQRRDAWRHRHYSHVRAYRSHRRHVVVRRHPRVVRRHH